MAFHAMLVARTLACGLTRCCWDHASLSFSSVTPLLPIHRVVLIKQHAGQQCRPAALPCGRPIPHCPSVVFSLTIIDNISEPTHAEPITTTYPESLIVIIAESITAITSESIATIRSESVTVCTSTSKATSTVAS